MDIISKAEGSYIVVEASGRLGFEEEDQARAAFEKAVKQAKAGVVVNCAKLEYLSSAGLRAFLAAAKAAEQKEVPFVVCALTQDVAVVFDISGFDHIIPVHKTVAAATAALKKAAS